MSEQTRYRASVGDWLVFGGLLVVAASIAFGVIVWRWYPPQRWQRLNDRQVFDERTLEAMQWDATRAEFAPSRVVFPSSPSLLDRLNGK